MSDRNHAHVSAERFFLYIRERCLYGALTSDIRTLLLSYKITKAVDTNQPYQAFLSHLLDDHPFHDLTFTIRLDDEKHYSFPAHRFLLAARSTFFQQQLLGRWRDQTTVKLSKSLVEPEAFAAVLQYLYTGHLGDVERGVLENMVFVGRHLELPDLVQRCQDAVAEAQPSRAYDVKEMAKLRMDLERFLQRILNAGAYYLDDDHTTSTILLTERFLDVQEEADAAPLFADVAVRLDDDKALFPVHRAFLCRSVYFKNMLDGTFFEANAGPSTIVYQDTATTLTLPVVGLTNVPSDVFQYVSPFRLSSGKVVDIVFSCHTWP